MTYTKRDAYAGFPDNLRMIPGDTPDMPDYARQAMNRHNRAIGSYFKGAGAEYSADNVRAERAILSLAAGIDGWVGSNPDGAGDGYGAPNVTVPLLQAFRAALNFDLGRLDGGTLDDWACDQLIRCGLDPDTGEFLP